MSRKTGKPRVSTRMAVAIAAVAVLGMVLVVVLRVRSALGPQDGAAKVPSECRSSSPQLSVLLIGNSYTQQNDLPAMLGEVLCKNKLATSLRIDSLTMGGASLADWASNGARQRIAGHDVVVLQDQSEIPGFGEGNSQFDSSRFGAVALANAAATAGARVVLFETWGHEGGDANNAAIYPTYEAMQNRLSGGYGQYLAAIQGSSPAQTEVSAAGQAWDWVNTHDPVLFKALYSADGSHPSIAGTYLAAMVLARSIVHSRLHGQGWRPANVSASLATSLEVAANSV